MPFIIAFEKSNDQYSDYRYDLNKGEFKTKNITGKLPYVFKGKEVNFEIGEENLIINNNNYSINIGSTNSVNPKQNVAGVYGLTRGFEGIEDLNKNYTYLNQLRNQNLISKQIFYIGNYYENNELT